MGFCKNLGVCSVLRAEALGLLEGIRIAANLAFDNIEIECDSRVLVESILGRCAVCPEIARVVEMVRQCLERFECWRIIHNWRESNGAADFLAGLGLRRIPIELHLFQAPPAEMLRLLEEDVSGIGTLRMVRVSDV